MLKSTLPEFLKMQLGLAALAAFVTPALGAAEFYVAPHGNDSHSGTRGYPFASFQRAQQAVRAERIAHPDRGVTVTFRAGRYELPEPIEFTPADSGASTNQPVCYRAARGTEVVFSGGRLITGWQADAQRRGVWKTRVAEPKPGDDFAWRFEQLWVNGQRAIRARTPNYWEFNTLLGVSEGDGGEGRANMRHLFRVQPPSLATLRGLGPEALHDAQLVVFHKWDTTREWLETAAPDRGEFTTRGAKMQSWNAIERDCLCYLENYLEALDAPGEWFLARDGWLYYWPRPGENLATAQVVAPRLDRFLEIGRASCRERV
jgi:hypothetical protein